MMATQAQKKQVSKIVDKCFSLDNPDPMDQRSQAYFQRRCAQEAKLLRFFLTKPLTKKAQKEISDFEQYFSGTATMPVVAIGLSESLAPFLGRSLTAYRQGRVYSYRRRPKGKMYERG